MEKLLLAITLAFLLPWLIPQSTADEEAFCQPNIWSNLLQEWAVSPPSEREGRVMQAPPRYIPTSKVYITKRMGSASPPVTVIKPNYYSPTANNVNRFDRIDRIDRIDHVTQQPSEISETDLYLLGAIEKLVYRVDYMEKRLRKSEQLIYYLMAGNQNQKEIIEEPCGLNFTRIGQNCYLFGIQQTVNWKTANGICRSYGAQLAELESLNENSDIVAYLLNHHSSFKGHNSFWLGGLNPGLLWIWSTSARPVNPNVNLAMLQNANQTTTQKPSKILDNGFPKGNSTNGVKGEASTGEIEGNGRCLSLIYNTEKHIYKFHGTECTSRRQYLCEIQKRDVDNEISRIAKRLMLPD